MKKTNYSKTAIDNKIYLGCIKSIMELWYKKGESFKIMDIIEEYTNKNYNFDMYFDYDDSIDIDYIDEFINKYRNCYDNLEQARYWFQDFIEEKYDYFNDSLYYYEEELAGNIDCLDFVKDSREIINKLQDEHWILYLDFDIFELIKRDNIPVRIYEKSRISEKYTSLFNSSYEYKDIKENIDDDSQDLTCMLCKSNGFNLSDIFEYNIAGKGTYEDEKWITKRKEIPVFDDMYIEFNNTMDYNESIYFLCYMDIDEILNFSVKDSKFNFNHRGSFWLYSWYAGAGSVFGITNRKDCIMDTSELKIDMYDSTSMDSVYWFYYPAVFDA